MQSRTLPLSSYYLSTTIFFIFLAYLITSANFAQAAISSGEYYITSKHSNLCMDIIGASTSNGAKAQQYNCSASANNQRFLITDLGNDAYSIEAKHSGKVLDVAGFNPYNGLPLQQWSWGGANNQRWQIKNTATGYEISPLHLSSFCVDIKDWSTSNSGTLHLWQCHGGNNQKWILKNTSSDILPLTIESSSNTSIISASNFNTKTNGGNNVENSWMIWSNGYIEHNFNFNNPTSITVVAKGNYAAGAWPQMQVSVAERTIDTVSVNSDVWKSFTFTTSNQVGTLPIRIAFTNDYYANGEDRNLTVKSVAAITGTTSTSTPIVTPKPTVTPAPAVTPKPTATPVPVITPPPAETTPVTQHGALSVRGINLVNKLGNSYQMRGVSSAGLHWYGHFMNEASIEWMRDDWRANVVRAAMYTAQGGYLSDPSIKNKVIEIVNAAIKKDIYVIIDWHILYDNNPQTYKTQAIEFFQEMATLFGKYPNVIYEIANEPNGNINWNNDIRPYAVDVIRAIRQIDPDNIIVVGTGTWSQDIHHAADNPLPDSNIMYALHFYAGTHGQELRDRINYAHNKNIAIFVTEWGTSQASGDGGVYPSQTETWISFLNGKKISWVGYSLTDKNESSALLLPGANYLGRWPEYQLSPSGKLVRQLILKP
ncbi:MAG: cellulase family glycosylhydrolase [Pseudomonadota bacterium]